MSTNPVSAPVATLDPTTQAILDGLKALTKEVQVLKGVSASAEKPAVEDAPKIANMNIVKYKSGHGTMSLQIDHLAKMVDLPTGGKKPVHISLGNVLNKDGSFKPKDHLALTLKNELAKIEAHQEVVAELAKSWGITL